MRLALYQPDIPQNTGTILRLAACLDVTVDVIGPTGFDMSDRSLKRAGLDYLGHVKLQKHISFVDFQNAVCRDRRLLLLTTHAERSYLDFRFDAQDILLLGRESSGVPDTVHDIAAERLKVPIKQDLRSLNIAMAASMILGEALRQTKQFPV